MNDILYGSGNRWWRYKCQFVSLMTISDFILIITLMLSNNNYQLPLHTVKHQVLLIRISAFFPVLLFRLTSLWWTRKPVLLLTLTWSKHRSYLRTKFLLSCLITTLNVQRSNRLPLIVPVERFLGFAGFDAANVMRSACHNLLNQSGGLGLAKEKRNL